MLRKMAVVAAMVMVGLGVGQGVAEATVGSCATVIDRRPTVDYARSVCDQGSGWVRLVGLCESIWGQRIWRDGVAQYKYPWTPSVTVKVYCTSNYPFMVDTFIETWN